MATFKDHISQSISNLDFLEKINSIINNRWDWQVTVCFYSALHLMNAHIVKKTGKNYLSHYQVSELLNPYNTLSVAKLDEQTYISYTKLLQLSRRSRYLLNEDFKKKEKVDIQPASLTFERHLNKSIYHLDNIMFFMADKYKVDFLETKILSSESSGISFKYFIVSE